MVHTFRQLVAHGLTHRVAEWKAESPTHLVVLLHGYMDAALTWDRVAPELAKRGAWVVAPDLRGYGEGGARAPEGSSYHFPDYVFDIADLVGHYDASLPLAVVGHSMGGTAATLYAATFPERVRALALLEGLGPPDNPPDVAPVRLRRWIDETRRVRHHGRAHRVMSREAALQRLRENHPTIEESVLRDRLQHLAIDVGGDQVKWAYDPLHKPMSPTPFQAPVFSAFIDRVTCPVLFVSGGKTGYHPPDEEERLARFTKLERAEIADAGHMMHWTRPAELSRILEAYLERTMPSMKGSP